MYKLIKGGIADFNGKKSLSNVFCAFIDSKDPTNLITVMDIANGDDAERQLKVLESLGVNISYKDFQLDTTEAHIPVPICSLDTGMMSSEVSEIMIPFNIYDVYYRDDSLAASDALTNDSENGNSNIRAFISNMRECFDCDDTSLVDKAVKKIRLDVSDYPAIQSSYYDDQGIMPFPVYVYNGEYNSEYSLTPIQLPTFNSDYHANVVGDSKNPCEEVVGIPKQVNGVVRSIHLPTFAELVVDVDSTNRLLYSDEDELNESNSDSGDVSDIDVVSAIETENFASTSEFTSNSDSSTTTTAESSTGDTGTFDFNKLYIKSRFSMKPYVIGKFETPDDYINVIDAYYPNTYYTINDFYNLYKPDSNNLPPETFKFYTSESGAEKRYSYADIVGHPEMNKLEIQPYEQEFYDRLVSLLEVGRSIEHNALSTEKYQALTDTQTSSIVENYIKILAQQAYNENWGHTGRCANKYVALDESNSVETDSESNSENGDPFQLPCLIGNIEFDNTTNTFKYNSILDAYNAANRSADPSTLDVGRRQLYADLLTKGELRYLNTGFKAISAHVDEVKGHTRWAETLIKLLRFGTKKPNILCLNNCSSYFNLNDCCKTLFDGNRQTLTPIIDPETLSSVNIDAVIHMTYNKSDLAADLEYLVSNSKLSVDVANALNNSGEDIELPIAFLLREVNSIVDDNGVAIPISETLSIVDGYELTTRITSGNWNVNGIVLKEDGTFEVADRSIPTVIINFDQAVKMFNEINSRDTISRDMYIGYNKLIVTSMLRSNNISDDIIADVINAPQSIAKAFIENKFKNATAGTTYNSVIYNEKIIAENYIKDADLSTIDDLDGNVLQYPEIMRLILFCNALEDPSVIVPNTNIITYYNSVAPSNSRTMSRKKTIKHSVKNLNMIYCFSVLKNSGAFTCINSINGDTAVNFDPCVGHIVNRYLPRYLRAQKMLISYEDAYLPEILLAFSKTNNDEVITEAATPKSEVASPSASGHFNADFIKLVSDKFSDSLLIITDFGGYIVKKDVGGVLISADDCNYCDELKSCVKGVIYINRPEHISKKENVILQFFSLFGKANGAYKSAGLNKYSTVEECHSNYNHPIPYKTPEGYRTIMQIGSVLSSSDAKIYISKLKKS